MKILEPKIKPLDIEVEINDNQEAYDSITNVWGRMRPMVKINEYVLPPNDVLQYEFDVVFNEVPTITLRVNDSQFSIRNTLENEYIDFVTIFVGHRNWYHKITCIITEIYNDANDDELLIMGKLHIPKLYDTKQSVHNQTSVSKIIENICSESDIGLYQINNDSLGKIIDSIQPNIRQLDYIKDVVSKHTDNVWMIDNFYYLHIGNIESMKQQKVSTFNFKDGFVWDEPQPIKLVSNPNAIDSSLVGLTIEEDNVLNRYFKIQNYTINTSIGTSVLDNYLSYKTKSNIGENNLFNQIVNTDVGSGDKTNNTFSAFTDKIGKDICNYKSILNKTIRDKVIKVFMTEPLYEISPFMNVELELSMIPNDENAKETRDVVRLDKANSGIKTVIGFSMIYVKSNGSSNPTIQQTITLI